MSCAKKGVPEGTVIAAQPDGEVGQTTRCPVSGVSFTAAADSAKLTLGGRTCHACCAGCIEKLKNEPARFVRLKPLREGGATQARTPLQWSW